MRKREERRREGRRVDREEVEERRGEKERGEERRMEEGRGEERSVEWRGGGLGWRYQCQGSFPGATAVSHKQSVVGRDTAGLGLILLATRERQGSSGVR